MSESLEERKASFHERHRAKKHESLCKYNLASTAIASPLVLVTSARHKK
jgi:hypothetical protein